MALTDLGKIRLLIQDPAGATQQFSDDELQFFLDDTGNVFKASALALRAWSTKLAREEEMIKLGQWQGDKGDVCRKLLDLAVELDKRGAAAGSYFGHARMDWTAEQQAQRELSEAEGS